jgi:hypothetical protein
MRLESLLMVFAFQMRAKKRIYQRRWKVSIGLIF